MEAPTRGLSGGEKNCSCPTNNALCYMEDGLTESDFYPPQWVLDIERHWMADESARFWKQRQAKFDPCRTGTQLKKLAPKIFWTCPFVPEPETRKVRDVTYKQLRREAEVHQEADAKAAVSLLKEVARENLPFYTVARPRKVLVADPKKSTLADNKDQPGGAQLVPTRAAPPDPLHLLGLLLPRVSYPAGPPSPRSS